VAKWIARALARDRSARFISAWQMLGELIEVAPAEGRLMPAKAYTSLDLRAPAAPAMMARPSEVARAVADASGPHLPASASGPFNPASASGPFKTVVAAPLSPEASGPYGAVPSVSGVRHPERRRHRPAPPPPPPSSRGLLVIMALCALLLGVGLTMYLLVGLHHRPPASSSSTAPH
jgi:hypothetical protein